MIASTDTFVTGFAGIVTLFVAGLVLVIAVVWIAFPFIMRSLMNELIHIQREQGKVLIEIAINTSKSTEIKLGEPPITEFNRFASQVCKCNVCSKPIEFKTEQVGQTIACPHCGLETILFLPKVNA